MKKIFIVFEILLFACLVPTYVFAYSFTDITFDHYDSTRTMTELKYVDNIQSDLHDGTLLGVLTGNDSNQLDDISQWLVDKHSFASGFQLFEEKKTEYEDYNAEKYGTWSVSPAVGFYAVKAGDAFALYELTPVQSSIKWNTYDLWIRGYGGNSSIEVSHITGYNPVPEPATMFLFGIGLLGIARVSKRKR